MKKIAISSLPTEEVEQLFPLLRQSPQKPNRYLFHDLLEELNLYWLNEVQDALRREGSKLFIARLGSRIIGMAVLGDLPWETNIFGKQMGIIKHLVVQPQSGEECEIATLLLERVTKWAAECGTQFLLCKTHTDDIPIIHALEGSGFLLMDTQLDYVFDFRQNPINSLPSPVLLEGVSLRLADEQDEAQLVDVAEACFSTHFGRFHTDEKISKDQATQVYVEWIRSCLHGYADWIVVAEANRNLLGYSAWKRPSALEWNLHMQIGHYSIGAVHPAYPRRGLFTALTYEGMRLFDGAVVCIEGPTHINNYGVQRGYARLGWQIRDAHHSFHKWLGSDM
jgi:hypothetical protein